MSKGNSYNRIVFLTTFSLYLGLVLVSGNACVFSHSALNKHFDLKNEIEYKDDFDNQPDDESEIAAEDLPLLLAELFDEIRDYAKTGEIDLQSEFRADAVYNRIGENSGNSSVSTTISNERLNLFVQKALNEEFSPRLLRLADLVENKKAAGVHLQGDSSRILLKTSFSKNDAADFAEFLNKKFQAAAAQSEDSTLKEIYKNTIAAAENNQVFVVTNLPRAALESSN